MNAQEALGQNQQRASKQSSRARVYGGISEETLLHIMRAEDERRFDNDLSSLLTDRDARVRQRAALAAGRIGDERAVLLLIALLGTDSQAGVRAMAAFALGETELPSGADALLNALQNERLPVEVRARSIEALGKITAALPKTEEAKQRALGDAILKALSSALENQKASREFILLGLTAVLRARPANASAVVARALSNADARIRADALNTLARLKAKDLNEQVRALLANDADAVVRANAARVLGVAEDAGSLDALITRGATDEDERARVSAIRALGSLKNARAAAPLLERAAKLMASYKAAKKSSDIHPRETNELLEIATTLGRLLANTGDANAVAWLREFREAENATAPEVEIAFALIAPASYLRERPFNRLSDAAAHAELQKNWRTVSSIAQGLGEIATLTAAGGGNGIVGVQADAQIILREMLDGQMELPALAVPDVLRALAAFKGGDLGELLRKRLEDRDVIVRATAAELLGELPPDEANTNALANALPVAMKDELNDAVLSILDSLAKQKRAEANESMK
ncbi:MAG: HEAT repeat domain-containing protein, partial [Pyrinomonadaceae bacterium]